MRVDKSNRFKFRFEKLSTGRVECTLLKPWFLRLGCNLYVWLSWKKASWSDDRQQREVNKRFDFTRRGSRRSKWKPQYMVYFFLSPVGKFRFETSFTKVKNKLIEGKNAYNSETLIPQGCTEFKNTKLTEILSSWCESP